MTKQLTVPLLYLFLVSANAADPQQEKRKCTSTPCANTATGEDPAEIDLRAVNAELDSIRASSDDKLRWQTVTLFSNSKDPKNQKLMVHKASGTEIALDAAKGLVVFRSPQAVNAFQIASVPDGTDNPCPKYQVEVVDASAEHAVVRKVCPKYEFGPGREFKSFDYYLYDRATATMRSIWSASAIQNASALKSPKPDPTVVPTAKGYKYQWKDNNASYNNIYERKKNKEGRLELVCKDMSVGKHGETEGGSCEGGILERGAVNG